MELDRFAKQSAEQLVAAIEASKERPLSLLLFGLGIRHVGKTVAQLLARRFGTMEALMKAARRRQINDVPGSGRAIAEAVVAFFAEPRNQELIGAARDARGSTSAEPRAATADGALSGKTYVLTGTLPTLSRGAGHRADRGRGRPGRREREQEDRCGRRGRGRREQAGEGEGARRRGHRRGRTLASRRQHGPKLRASFPSLRHRSLTMTAQPS